MSKSLITTLDCQRFISEFFEKFSNPWETSGREWMKMDSFKEGRMEIWEFKHIDHDIVVRVREFNGLLSMDNHTTKSYDVFANDLERRSQLKFEHFNVAMYPSLHGSGYDVLFALGTSSDDTVVSHLKPALYAIFQDVPISKTYKNNAQGLWIQNLPIEEINHRLQVLGIGENINFVRSVDPSNINRRTLGPSTYNPPTAPWYDKVVELSNQQIQYKAQLEEQKQLRIKRQEELRQERLNQQNAPAPAATTSTAPPAPNAQNRQSRAQSTLTARSWKDAKSGTPAAAEAPQDGRSISAPPITPSTKKTKMPEGSTSNNPSGFYSSQRSVRQAAYAHKPAWPARGSREAMDYINYYLSQPEIPAFELIRIKELFPQLETLEYTLVQGGIMLSAHIQEPAVKMVWAQEVERRKNLNLDVIPTEKVQSLDVDGLF